MIPTYRTYGGYMYDAKFLKLSKKLTLNFNEPLKFISNPNESLSNPLFPWRAASVHTSLHLLSACWCIMAAKEAADVLCGE
jgi:hypothetical protein